MRVNIYIFLLILVCPQCQNDKDNSQSIYAPELPARSPFTDSWTYSFPFYSSELHINKDGTFKFHDQGCMGHGYSEGNWIQTEHNMIILTSFEKYNDKKAEEMQVEATEVKTENQPVKVKKSKTKQAKVEYVFDPSFIANTTVTYRVNIGDTINVQLQNQRLLLENDTLYRLDKNGFKDGAKFIRQKNYR